MRYTCCNKKIIDKELENVAIKSIESKDDTK